MVGRELLDTSPVGNDSLLDSLRYLYVMAARALQPYHARELSKMAEIIDHIRRQNND